ncbi:hypothetical protein MMC25_003552 [Agyrium rufum]|nr:hypothetical protein [Agyrium rufum]
MASVTRIAVAALCVGAAVLYNPIATRLQVLGVTRNIYNVHGTGLRIIPDSAHCEDLHRHERSGLLFAACEPDDKQREQWFPPSDCRVHSMEYFAEPTKIRQGSFMVIDPQTLNAKRLSFVNFADPFVTHGIDMVPSIDDPRSLYIFAINHLPESFYPGAKATTQPIAHSRVELFHHWVGSDEVTHLRSIWDPLIRTPNDIFGISPTEFFVTNDHHYRCGFMRFLEDALPSAGWTDTIHVKLLKVRTSNETEGVKASVAIDKLHNNNGLGHGATPDEVIIGQAASGIIHIAKIVDGSKLHIEHTIQMQSATDNPTYFKDPYVKITGRDASGYVSLGLAHAVSWPDGVDPSIAYIVRRQGDETDNSAKSWNHTILWQDDGNVLRSGSAALLIAVDPSKNGNRKEAQMFLTGPVSQNIVVTKVAL